MSARYVALLVALLIAAATVSAKALQPLVPHIPPPEASVYEILDLGPAPAAPCSCVPNAFALPSYRPGWGYSSGPAVPTDDAPISDADRRANQEWYAQEDQLVRRVSEEALAGNPGASLAVAMHLSVRKSVFGVEDRFEEEAIRWLTLAAEQRHPEAFRLLGHRYAIGRGVAQDYAEAAKWFDLGARLDDPISMTAIGFLRAAGRGAPQDWAVAIRWWQYAETRTPLASRFLGDAYACGAGVPEDRARAVAEYRRVAAKEISSSIQLGHMYVRGCARADAKEAVAAFQRAADEGYPDAQIELSELLREGRGAEANASDAYYWARLAERRLAPGALKTRADESARAAARLMSAAEIAAGDDRVKAVMEAGAKPVR